MSREAYFVKVRTFIEQLDRLPDDGPALQVKMNCVLMFSNELMRVYQLCNQDPIPPLTAVLDDQIEILRNTRWPDRKATATSGAGDKEHVRHLYEQAWTSYDQRTYEHSLKLMEDRFRANGLDEKFFQGKSCFDGGCGTGRVSIAMAKMGARVVGADIGVKSLAFAKERASERGMADRIQFMEIDVTNLAKFRDEEFDFVVSNGVLMCTGKCHEALREHFRITKQGGQFWIYLYGANGIMWDTYDLLRDAMLGIGPDRAKQHMLAMDTRYGMVYTFLDNVFAPIRTYHGTQEVLDVVASVAPIEARPQRGLSDVDDSVRQTSSPYGALIYGDECEVRQIVTRKSKT